MYCTAKHDELCSDSSNKCNNSIKRRAAVHLASAEEKLYLQAYITGVLILYPLVRCNIKRHTAEVTVLTSTIADLLLATLAGTSSAGSSAVASSDLAGDGRGREEWGSVDPCAALFPVLDMNLLLIPRRSNKINE